MKLYLEGSLSENGEQIVCSLSSSVILFLIRYCQTNRFELVFVPDCPSGSVHMCCTLQRNMFLDLSVTFSPWNKVPGVIRNVALPSLHQPECSLVRSGLCVLLRQIIKESHAAAPHLHLVDLLVSGFTKLCEVELPDSVALLISTLRNLAERQDGNGSSGTRELTLPNDLIKLDDHFRKRCRVHNDNKNRRQELVKITDCLRKQVLFQDNKTTIVIPQKQIVGEDTVIENNVINDTVVNNTDRDDTVGVGEGSPFIENCGEHLSPQKASPDCGGLVSLKCSTDICPGDELFRIKLDQLPDADLRLQIEHVTHRHHGIRRLRIDKSFTASSIPPPLTKLNRNNSHHHHSNIVQNMEKIEFTAYMKVVDNGRFSHGNPAADAATLTDISQLVARLSHLDVEYEHTYSEGVEMTLADLILYVYVYHLLEALHFRCTLLAKHVPSILQWANHMTSLATVVNTGLRLGWDLDNLAAGLTGHSAAGGDTDSLPVGLIGRSAAGSWQHCLDVVFVREVEIGQECSDHDMELSRCAKMKHKALRPEVAQALQKFEEANIRPRTGTHPCGENVHLDWDSLPAAVHPREGDVPQSRTDRKCQQLENLMTGVQAVSQPGHVLVDFCSGGGHLGILMAYLLRDCQVYLVENKEESLLKARSRLESLGLTNVTLYQALRPSSLVVDLLMLSGEVGKLQEATLQMYCNLDYFIGGFDVGVCLHACGSATDMVLQLCINNQASFVVCPCCYGSIQKTHLLSYPQSQQFVAAGITYKDFLTLGHAADQTEFNIALEEQGRLCMNLVDTDRAGHAQDLGYQVTLCSLKPPTCSPKNHLLIGTWR